jgi:hypothetical protein
MVARRRAGIELAEYAWPDSLRVWPTAYQKKALLRTDAQEKT